MKLAVSAAMIICLMLRPGVIKAADEIPLSQISIGLERSACKGSCPAYTIAINGVGNVVFNGKANVACMGPSTWQVQGDSVIGLVNRFLAAHFFEAADKYAGLDQVTIGPKGGLVPSTSVVTDWPGTKLTLKIGFRVHAVWLYDHAPKELEELVADVEGVSRASNCIRGGGG